MVTVSSSGSPGLFCSLEGLFAKVQARYVNLIHLLGHRY